MSEELKPTYQDDEIDLVELLQTIWDGKWLIATFSAIAVVFGGAFAYSKPSVFEAQTQIKEVTSVQGDKYLALNSLIVADNAFFAITPESLLDLFIENLEERTLFEDSIRKNELLKRSEFESDKDYGNAIVELAASIELLPPINEDGTDKGESRRYWSINFEGENSQKWLAVLDDVTQSATNSVQQNLVDRFENTLLIAKQSKRFKLEDLETSITNATSDYTRKTSDRLAFLREQAAIARKLGVAKNTLEAQTFMANTGVVANVKSDTPFYLRGYEAIEKEIELIESREDVSAFVDGLLKLEQEKRSLEQDRTLDRAKALLESTPIKSAEPFIAAEFDVYATDIESKSKRSLIVALALVLGGMVGVVYVLIRSAVRNRNAKLA
ncbi:MULTISPECIES: Wzz/FepE/Etk N-terminal domain-containing protein [unclassified Marinobacterium]|uniref:Wzz/FepE/Etk N-terminal domain-containing protein n=1 Tax=unclassified Marinobacterium TaxID=2644139 RepID=UPI001568702B|nr:MULTISPECIES: Wzz/FepE/Etk N-terminal domain-containing protein [unclassified Marinobacterium]NRP53017.1 LPS O-antigen length regulator [Marinobacterium sp. xm-v-242]NRP77598.1 LPS O-antigen length regulator [Marinobacterium sp. xm-m-383]